MARVTILHTSDVHNKLTSDLAAKLHDLKAAHPDSLMFDCGDAIWAGNVYWRPGGEPVLDLMNSVPYDAMCMGNREFHFSRVGMKAKLSRARFPVLSANLRSTIGPLPFQGRDGVGLFDRAGLRLAVFGLSVPCITERMLAKKVSDFYFEQPADTASELVPQLRDNDLVIALTHIGINKDRALAEAVPGIDIILGGHTHTEADERVGDTTILHSGHHAHFVRKVDVELDAGRVSVQSELIPLAKT